MINRAEIAKEGWVGVTVAIGLVCGATSLLGSWAPIVAMLGFAGFVLGFYYPTFLIFGVFAGILLDTQGATSVAILGLPFTLAKGSVAALIGVWTLHAVLRGKQLVSWTPVSTGLLLVCASMVMSVAVAMHPGLAWPFIAGVVLLTIMMHFVYQVIEDEEQMKLLFRLMATFSVAVFAWTLGTREEVVIFTLDNAWMQRTSGAYGDPNHWATALLVVCPMLIGSLSADEHWSTRPLLAGIAMLYPACLLQSYSRAGMVCAVLTAPALFYLLRNRPWLVAAGLLASAALVPFVVDVDSLVLRYATLLNPMMEADMGYASLRERRALLDTGLSIWRDHWLLGVGVGMFATHAAYLTAGGLWKVAHNSYVNIGAEQGLAGVVSHLVLFGTLGWAVAQAAFQAPTVYLRNVGVGFAAAVAGFALIAVTLNLATFGIAYFMFAIGLVVTRMAREAPRNAR